MLDEMIAHWARWGFGPWTVLLGGEPIGYTGLRHADVGGRPEVELMWFIDADHGARATRRAGARGGARRVRVLELDDVVAETVDVNRASRSVMEKLGMSYERDVVHVGLPHVVYRLRR